MTDIGELMGLQGGYERLSSFTGDSLNPDLTCAARSSRARDHNCDGPAVAVAFDTTFVFSLRSLSQVETNLELDINTTALA